MKRFIVIVLERACLAFHWLPPHKCRLGMLSIKLNDRWGLDEWSPGATKVVSHG